MPFLKTVLKTACYNIGASLTAADKKCTVQGVSLSGHWCPENVTMHCVSVPPPPHFTACWGQKLMLGPSARYLALIPGVSVWAISKTNPCHRLSAGEAFLTFQQ